MCLKSRTLRFANRLAHNLIHKKCEETHSNPGRSLDQMLLNF